MKAWTLAIVGGLAYLIPVGLGLTDAITGDALAGYLAGMLLGPFVFRFLVNWINDKDMTGQQLHDWLYTPKDLDERTKQ